MDSLELRSALGRFATGVCLITVNDPELGPLALTANSFASVSLEPPLVLWSIQNRAECFRAYTDCEFFGISILGAEQAALSNHYARRTQHGIVSEEFRTNAQGVPLLKEALATFSLRTHAVHAGGDHHIVVGEVLKLETGGSDPLLFVNGGYGRVGHEAPNEQEQDTAASA